MSTCLDVDQEPIAVVLVQGATFRVRLELTDKDGQALDITGWTWAVDLLNPDLTVATPITVTTLDGPGGVVELSIDEAITATLDPDDYTWPVWATDTTPDTQPLFTGLLRIEASP